MNRPFSVQMMVSDRPGILELKLIFGEVVKDNAKVAVYEIMMAFESLGKYGALSGTTINPIATNIELENCDILETTGLWSFRLVKVDSASLCILLNMVHWLHLEIIPVKAVIVCWPPNNALTEPVELRYPGRWPNISYDINIGELISEIDLEIEFVNSQQQQTLDEIILVMSKWLLATHRGAYTDEDFGPSKSYILFSPDVMDVKPERIVWFFDVFTCHDGAWDGLFNLLEYVHNKIASIKGVQLLP